MRRGAAQVVGGSVARALMQHPGVLAAACAMCNKIREYCIHIGRNLPPATRYCYIIIFVGIGRNR